MERRRVGGKFGEQSRRPRSPVSHSIVSKVATGGHFCGWRSGRGCEVENDSGEFRTGRSGFSLTAPDNCVRLKPDLRNMASRPLIIATLVGASVGVPYFASQSSQTAKRPASNPPSPVASVRSGQVAAVRATPATATIASAEPSPPAYRIRTRRAARRAPVHVRRPGAAVRCDEGVGLSQLGAQIDRPDGRRFVQRPRAAGDGHADDGARRFAHVLSSTRRGRSSTFRFAAARATPTQLVQLLTRHYQFQRVAVADRRAGVPGAERRRRAERVADAARSGAVVERAATKHCRGAGIGAAGFAARACRRGRPALQIPQVAVAGRSSGGRGSICSGESVSGCGRSRRRGNLLRQGSVRDAAGRRRRCCGSAGRIDAMRT